MEEFHLKKCIFSTRFDFTRLSFIIQTLNINFIFCNYIITIQTFMYNNLEIVIIILHLPI